MNYNQVAALGEAKAVAWLIARNYSVFTSFDGKAPFDLVGYKDGEVLRVQVKTTRRRTNSGRYAVSLKTVTHRVGGARAIPFSGTLCDMLLIYIEPEDKFVVLNPKDYDGRAEITVGP